MPDATDGRNENVITLEAPQQVGGGNNGSGGSVSPPIQIFGGDIAKVVDLAQDALIAAHRPVFQRAGQLVTPIWHEYDTANGAKTKITGFVPMNNDSVKYMLNKRVVKFLQHDGRRRALIEVDPPIAVCAAMLRIAHWKFRRIVGLFNAPTMRHDGSIIDQRGYDETTHVWVDWDVGLTLPPVSIRPSKDEAIAALTKLRTLLVGFPFVKKLDESVALAAILSAILRPAFDLCPLVLLLSHVSGTGKSYFADLISTIINGRPCPVIAASKNQEEMEKRLGALLLESPPIISLDNLSFNLTGDIINQICTSHIIKVRVLGKSETPSCEWRGLLTANGNNVMLGGDLVRRGLICNLNAKVERPELRRFKFEPVERAAAERGKFIAAAITIARHYLAVENKINCVPIASYKEWSNIVREPLIYLDLEDPVKSMDQARKEDPEHTSVQDFVGWWAKPANLNEQKTSAKLSELGMQSQGLEDWAHPELHECLLQVAGNARGGIDTRRLGQWLGSIRGKIVKIDGKNYCVERAQDNHGNRYQLKCLGPEEA